jgi:hypothetical protein
MVEERVELRGCATDTRQIQEMMEYRSELTKREYLPDVEENLPPRSLHALRRPQEAFVQPVIVVW